MAQLTAARRNALPKSDFAVPSKDGYPVDTLGRARSALSRVDQFGSPQEKAQVRRKVAREYPGIKQSKPAPGREQGGPQAKKTGNGNGGAREPAKPGGGTTQRLARELGRRLDARMTPRR